MEAHLLSLQEVQKAEHLAARQKELMQRVQSRFDLFLERKDPAVISDSLRREFEPFLHILTHLRAHPEAFLQKDAPAFDQKTGQWTIPEWIHQQVQTSGTPEEAVQRTATELTNHSWFAKPHPIDQDALQQLFTVKDAFRRRIEFERSGTSTAPPKTELTPAEVLGYLSDTIKEQIFWDIGSERATEAIRTHFPEMAIQTPVRTVAYKMPIETGLYFGTIAGQHFIGGNLSHPESLSDLAEGAAEVYLDELTSIVVHELIHAKQAEIQEERVLARKQRNRYFSHIPRTQSSLFKEFAQLQIPPDDYSIIHRLIASAEARKRFHGQALELPRAITEGAALVAQHYVLSRMIEQETSSAKKQSLRTLKIDLRKTTFCDALLRKAPFYLQGVQIFVPLYREFRIKMLPEYFRQMDLEALLQEPDPDQALKAFVQDPRIIPGLSSIPAVAESLRQQPPSVISP